MMSNQRASDIMTSPVITVKKDMRLTDVIELMLNKRIGAVMVVDDDDMVQGMISEFDVMNLAFDGHAMETTAGEAMSTHLISFPPEASIEELVSCCVSRRIRRIPIVKEGKLVGIVSRRDILREIHKMYSRF